MNLAPGLSLEQMLDRFEEAGADTLLVGPVMGHEDAGVVLPILAGSHGGACLPFIVRAPVEALGVWRRQQVLDAARQRRSLRAIDAFETLLAFYQAGATHWPEVASLAAALEVMEQGGSRA